MATGDVTKTFTAGMVATGLLSHLIGSVTMNTSAVSLTIMGDKPPTVSVLALASPSPGVQITVGSFDSSSYSVSVFRSSASSPMAPVRGAVNQIFAGSYTVDDFEPPLGELLTYTAVGYRIDGTPSPQSTGVTITLASASTWLSDPITPGSAVAVRIGSAGDVDHDIDAAFLGVIGSDSPVMIAGTRQLGSGQVTFTVTDLASLLALRAVLLQAPVMLLRTPNSTWDIGARFLGIAKVSEKRVGPLAEPTRLVVCDVTYVRRPDASLAGPLHTWNELLGKGYTWSQLANADLTWIQLEQRGGL
jgi:hypothetical protein